MVSKLILLLVVLIVVAYSIYTIRIELQYRSVQKKMWIMSQFGFKYKVGRVSEYPVGGTGDFGMWVSQDGSKIVTEEVFNQLSCRKLKELAEG